MSFGVVLCMFMNSSRDKILIMVGCVGFSGGW